MPARQRRTPASENEAETAENPPAERHTEATPKMVTGRISSDPTSKIAAGKKITTFRVTEEGKKDQLPTVWSAEVWNERRAKKAFEELRTGDEITVIGSHKPDRDWNGTTYTHQLAVRDIGVEFDEKTVGIDQFDRSMLRTPDITDTPDLNLLQGGQSAADGDAGMGVV